MIIKIKNFFNNQKGDYVQMLYMFPIYLLVFAFLAIRIDLIATKNLLDDSLRVGLRSSVNSSLIYGDHLTYDQNILEGLRMGLKGDDFSRKDGNVGYIYYFYKVSNYGDGIEILLAEGDDEDISMNWKGQAPDWNDVRDYNSENLYIIEVIAYRKSRFNTGWTSIKIGGETHSWITEKVYTSGRMIVESGGGR